MENSGSKKERFGVLAEENVKVKADADLIGSELRRQQTSFDTSGVKRMTGALAEMNGAVEELDRYDDFSALKIDISKYERSPETGGYGIARRPEVQGTGGIILDHQRNAALAFLRELRGFGLLADVVGSGKTYEAGVVLSELAVRGKVTSLLIVVPGQVYDTWVDVLESQFGMGKGSLMHVGADPDAEKPYCERAGAFYRPVHPMIVKTDDFAGWPESACKYLFDVIVVDEAHHLCAEGGKYARAMRMLSSLMETKKAAGTTYCLLLTATPHTGNLANMFRLWYFIRRNGGVPSDFDEKEDYERTEEYRSEKRHYMEDVCRGASTVLEFIKKVKLREVSAGSREAFERFLSGIGVSESDYAGKTEGEKAALADDFLAAPGNAELKKTVTERVASAYHNGVLRSIMIRQAKNPLAGRRKKYVFNELFLPTRKQIGNVTLTMENSEPFTLDLSTLADGGTVTADGKKQSLREFLTEYSRTSGLPYKQAYALMMRQLMPYFCEKDTDEFPADIFEKSGSARYYLGRLGLGDSEPTQETAVVPVEFGRDPFSYKMEETRKILRAHKGKRVLVFFDYDVERENSVSERFAEELKKDKEFASRVLTGSKANAREAAEQFTAKKDAILVVLDPSLTEGANLQACNIIINFSVTPDPLAMDQRIGRIFRLGQDNDVYIYSLAVMNELEGYALMYFSGIGLLSAGSGDATIISGSNSERMIAVRCPVCRNVKLYSQEDYEAKKKNDDLYCRETEECCNIENPKGTRMDEISVWDFKCDSCGKTFTRSVAQEGYFCMSQNTSGGIMCNSGEFGDRSMYCRKICAVAHCRLFTTGARKDCAALARYREKGGAVSNTELMKICDGCTYSDICCGRIDSGAAATARCSTCESATCFPKPVAVNFDDRWEADCPVCAASGRSGRLRRVTAHTFAAYLRAAWNFKGDRSSFCYNLEREVFKGAEVRNILRMDKEAAK